MTRFGTYLSDLWKGGNGLRLSLLAISLYITIASLLVTVRSPLPLNWYTSYYHLVTFLAVGLSLFGLKAEKTVEESSSAGSQLFLWLGGLLVWWWIRRQVLFDQSLWFDELTQFLWGVDWKRGWDTALFAATQQQPPIDYFLSAFANLYFGQSEWSVLAHAIFFGLASYVLFVYWLGKVKVPWPIVPVYLFLFAGQYVLKGYSSEARPVSIGVFFGLLCLFFFRELVGGARGRGPLLGASALLLVFCTSLQPIFFLSALSLAAVPLAWKRRELKKICEVFGWTWLLPMVLHLPAVWVVYREAVPQHQFYESSHWISWWTALRSIKFSSLSPYFRSMEYGNWIFLFPLASLLVVSARPCWFRGRATLMIKLSVAALLFSILFPISFHVFWQTVNWPLYARYYVLWILGSLALVAWLSGVLLEGAMRRKFGVGLLLLASVLLLTFRILPGYLPEQQKMLDEHKDAKPDWRAIAHLARVDHPTWFVEAPFAEFSWQGYGLYHFLGGLLYLKPGHRIPALAEHEDWTRLKIPFATYRLESLGEAVGPTDVFFLVRNKWNLSAEELQELQGFLRPQVDEVYPGISGYLVFRKNDLKNPRHYASQFFDQLSQFKRDDPRNFYLLDALAAESGKIGDSAAFRIHFDRLKGLVGSHPEKFPSEVNSYLGRLGRIGTKP